MKAKPLIEALTEAETATREEADHHLGFLAPLFSGGGYTLRLVGSLTRKNVGKDIDIRVMPPDPAVLLEDQLGFFYEQIVPVLLANGWEVSESPLERADGPGWLVSCADPAGKSVEFYVDGPLE